MLKIRLQRIGRKNAPSFRLVLTDSRNSTKSGKSLEILGFHDFQKDGTKLKNERILHWISKGAQVSDTAHNLLVSNKVLTGKKRNVLPKKTYVKPVEEAKPEVKAAPASVAEAVVEAPKEEPQVEAAPVVEEVKVVEETPAA